MCKQVSRLGFFLLGYLPAEWQWLHNPFVSFTVTGIVRKFHPCSLEGQAFGVFTHQHTLFTCYLHYTAQMALCQCFIFPAA